MRRRAAQTVLFVLLLASLSVAPSSAQDVVTVAALVQYPERYDGEVVNVNGTVTGYRERVSHTGDPYTLFNLREGRAAVAVFAWPHQGLRDGTRVRVTGAFIRVKTYTFIKAQRTVVLRP